MQPMSTARLAAIRSERSLRVAAKRAFAFLWVAIVAGQGGAEEFNALKPKGEAGELVVLTERAEQTALDVNRRSPGKYPWITARYDIVLPPHPTPQEQKAAFELERWLEEITGAMFAVVSEGVTPDDRPAGRKAIHIGRTRGLEDAGFVSISQDMGDDGYIIRQRDGNLYLDGGRKRGPINAVLALLEEDLGCRWLPDEVNVVPRQPELSFRPVPRTFVPKLQWRETFYWQALSPTWALRNRTNSPQTPIPDEWGGYPIWALRTHSHHLLVPPDKYFEQHPDYYGKARTSDRRDPHYLCLTNPALVPIATSAVRDVLKQSPGARYVMIAKEDGGHHGCFCDRCTAIAEREGSEQATHLMFVNAIADQLEAEFPEVLFCGYAYTYTVKAPKSIRPRANVGIRLCNNDGHDEPFTSVADLAEFQDTFRGWRAICPADRLFIYDYWSNPSHPKMPLPNMEMIARNIRWFAEQGVREVSGLGTGTWYPNGDRSEMRTWVTAKLLWDPTLDVRALMRDFNSHYYGKAAAAMDEYDTLLADTLAAHADAMRRPEGGRRFTVHAPIYSREFLDRAPETLAKADRQAESAEIRKRIARVTDTIEYLKAEQRP